MTRSDLQQRRGLLPSTASGWLAVLAGSIVVVLAILLPRAQSILHGRFGDSRVLVTIVLVLAGLACAIVLYAHRSAGERSRLFLVISVLLVTISGFWLLFAIGNLLTLL